MVRAPEQEIEIDGEIYRRCSGRAWGCNWLVPDSADSPRCLAGQLIRRRPANDDTIALEKLAMANVSLRRLVFQLLELELPITGYWEQEGGLAFDLLSSLSDGQRVTIGHADGVVTIDLAETLDARREALRVSLGEPYRTMLGHFRHEVGHYYEWVLVESGPLIHEARELFGDERQSYQEAIDRHYTFGPPKNWRDSFISEYATMHPWEDFAECFAHYLHITDTLNTARESGLVLAAERANGVIPNDVIPKDSYADASIKELVYDWQWLSRLFNRVNRSMGKADLYPFDLNRPVVNKLGFIHRMVTQADPTPHHLHPNAGRSR